jgi:hypothetical protein
MMTAHVYRLTDSLYFNSDTTLGNIRDHYYATDEIGYDPTPIGTKTFLDQPFDSVDLKRAWWKRTAAMHAPFLAIRLNDDFGKALLGDTALFVSQRDFLSEYHGLRVAVEPVAGAFGKMLSFSPSADETKLVLYYTNADSSSQFSFIINNECIRFNNYITDHSTACADLQNQLNSSSPQTGNQRLYLQPLNGVRIKVNFDGIEKLRNRNIVINEAKLYLNNAEPYDANLKPPDYLTIYTIEKDGKTKLTLDAELGQPYLGGPFDSNKNRYVMRLTRYLQKRILHPDMDNDNLYISISGASLVASRVVLYGNDPIETEGKVKIRILYSEY